MQAIWLLEVAVVTAQRAFPPTPDKPRDLITRQEVFERGLNKYRLNRAAVAGRIRYYKPAGWTLYDAIDVNDEIERLKINSPWELSMVAA